MRAFLFALVTVVVMHGPARAQEPISRADSADVLVGTAERLRAQGADELADALARMVERRYAGTPAHARALALLADAAAPRASRAGQVGLVSFTTIYGSWLGIAVPLMFEADRPEAYGLGLLTGAPLGFFGGRLYARDRSVSGGDAGVISWGGLWGSWQGAGWMSALGDSEECNELGCFDEGPDGNETVGASVVGGLLGMGAGMLAAHNTDIGGGTATMIGWGSLWGTGAGLVGAVLFDLGDGDEPLVAALIGGDAGLASMAVLAPGWRMSTGRAWLVNAGGVLGGAIGGGVLLLMPPNDEKVAVMFPTVGAALGLGIAAFRTRDMDEGRIRQGSLDDRRDEPGALVRLRDGAWRVAPPLATPVLLGEPNAASRELGIRVEILDARF